MDLIDFEFENLDSVKAEAQPHRVELRTTAQVMSSVTVIDSSDKERWRELQDYVVEQIKVLHGPFVRDAKKEAGIFKAFIGRWGFDNAMAIARAAFEAHGGMWHNSPVRVQRFARGSDPYFAQQIAAFLGIPQ